VCALLVAALLAGCASPADPTSDPPAADPDGPAVQGEVTVRDMSVSNGPVVFTPGDPDHEPPETDAEDRERWVEAAVSWLDRHLSDLEEGGSGLLDEVAMGGMLDGDESAVAAISSDLASSERPVDAAAYELLVAVDGDVQWIRALVRTSTRDGDAETTFVFVPGDGIQLVAAGEGGLELPEEPDDEAAAQEAP
jgi:hypothetical protein